MKAWKSDWRLDTNKVTRRNLLAATLAVKAFGGAAWKKKYADWKREDALEILNHSPWAQTGKVEFKMEGKDIEGPRSGGVVGPMEGPPGGNGTVGPPGGAPARAGGGIIQHGPEAMPNFRVLVRWESARPVRLAMGIEQPAETLHLYTLAVIGFPILKVDLASSLDALKAASRLERPGKERLWAARVEGRETTGQTALLFQFNGDFDPITADDKDVQFVTRLGAMNLRVKFNLRDMNFENKRAI